MLVPCIKFACVHGEFAWMLCRYTKRAESTMQVQWTSDLLKVLYVEHLHQSVDCQSLQDGVDGGRTHICADVLLQAQHAPLRLKLVAVAAHHVHKAPKGLRLHEIVQEGP